MSAEVAAVLRDARALIEDESAWTKGKFSRDGSFCALGAVRASRCKVPALTGIRFDAAQALEKRIPQTLRYHRTVWEFNDHASTTHADVLALFDRAIAAEEASA